MRFAILVAVAVMANCGVISAGEKHEKTPLQRLEETAELFFQADNIYQTGDLIVQSQAEDFRDYLRKTRRTSLAAQAGLLKRMEPDGSRLARIFYSSGGRHVLREAAQEVGGYELLERYCRTKEGWRNLNKNVKLGQAKQIVELIAAKQAVDAEAINPSTHPGRYSPTRIYTVVQLVEAMLAHHQSSKSKISSSDNGLKPVKPEINADS